MFIFEALVGYLIVCGVASLLVIVLAAIKYLRNRKVSDE